MACQKHLIATTMGKKSVIAGTVAKTDEMNIYLEILI